MKRKERKPLKICKVFGIDIEIHPSWFFIFILFSYIFASNILPRMVPGQPVHYYWLFGVGIVLIVFLSVLIHELAHSLVAQRFGLSVKKIILFILGGVANIEEEPKSVKSEFWIAIVGPLSSLALFGIFWLFFRFLNAGIPLVVASLFYLYRINLVLAIFNLVPGYPMDGGRILKTIIWKISGDELKAVKWASRVGQVIAFLIISFGISSLLQGNIINGVWLAFIGWFLFNAAGGGYRNLVAKRLADRTKADQIAKTLQVEDIKPEEICNADDNLNVILEKMQNRKWLYLVENGKVTKIITRDDVAEYLAQLELEEEEKKKKK